jgi:hypothetical protein
VKGANPKKEGALQGRNPCQTCEELESESSSFVHVFAVLFFLSDLHNKILFQTGFPPTPNWFSPWEFFQGHVDQKLICSFVMFA